MSETKTDRQGRPVQDCPQCGTSITRGVDDAALRLPAECPNCQEIARSRRAAVDQTSTEQPEIMTSGEMMALRRNVAGLQGDVSKLTAAMLALQGDLTDIRRAIGAEPPVPAASTAKGRRR